MKYSSQDNMKMAIISQIPKIIYNIKQEHTKLKKIIENYKIDGIISDNRFGLWNKNCRWHS